MSSYPGDERFAAEQAARTIRAMTETATHPTPPAGALLTDEQIALLIEHHTQECADMCGPEESWTVAALRELQAHRSAARVSGGEAVEPEPPLSWWKGHIKLAADAFTSGDISAGKLGEVLGASDLHGFKAACGAFGEPVPQPAAQEVAPAHELKCWPEYFGAVLSGAKRFEIRENDRGFDVGHVVTLREWEPGTSAYTGRTAAFRIGYLTSWGQKPGTVVFSLDALSRVAPPAPSVDLEQLARETADTLMLDWDVRDGGIDSTAAVILAALQRSREGAQK